MGFVERQGNSCINRLRMIDGAKQQWALEHHKTASDVPTAEDIRIYFSREGAAAGGGAAMPTCPQGGTYTIGRVGEPPKCSYPGHRLE